MDNREEVREFLTSRRAKITPDQAGLPAGSRRRVPGLRRSEVAALADMSVEYYAKLERGNLAGASPAVLEAVARALRLDDAERAHLLHLAQAADGSDALTRPRRRTAARQWTPHRSLQWTLDAITAGPAIVGNGRMDILAANSLARAFYTDLFANPDNQRNLARFNFLDPASRRFYPDWELFGDMAVAILRREAGRDPHDKDLHDLIGELSTRSGDFRARWGAHNVRRHGTGTKRFRHPAVGDLTLAYESLDLAAEPGFSMTIYTAEPGSPSEEGLRLLASLAATEAVSPAEQHPTAWPPSEPARPERGRHPRQRPARQGAARVDVPLLPRGQAAVGDGSRPPQRRRADDQGGAVARGHSRSDQPLQPLVAFVTRPLKVPVPVPA